MTQDAAFQELATAFTDFKTDVTASFDNITSDIQGLEAKVGKMSDLTPANEAIRQEILAGFATIKTRAKQVADIEPDVAVVEPGANPIEP